MGGSPHADKVNETEGTTDSTETVVTTEAPTAEEAPQAVAQGETNG